ncbi:hypothetical protein EDC38_1245 [Marinimicrobium koreense]|uniref:Uncharacterized protein n=1 Tax=Marinimicrobium koreense TaxID=306545 RepID=A0A3N1NP81_9GAMM|nr:hypothetical protein [Marinimicrobium koreense]ROQ20632.1 hypothetical protein EDC38_1245 [Marinimicrobium koreense]
MSSLIIASIIFALLIVLVGYAFIAQTLEKRKKRRQRLLTALKHRQRNFKYMVSGFPEGLLTKDLTLIIYRALLDACEQLSRLEPREPGHMEDFTFYSGELEALKHRTPSERPRTASAEQAVEIKRLLQELYRFIAHQTERGNIGQAHGQTYKDQIKRLALLVSVDAHAVSARQAQAAGKPRLAIHYYNLARKMLTQEKGGQGFQKQLAQINGIIKKLESQLEQQSDAGASPTTEGPAPEEKKEWEEFEQESHWKKKQLYD